MKEFEIKKFIAGQYITLAGSQANNLIYIIKEGLVEIKIISEIRYLKKGDFLSLISTLSKREQLTTAFAYYDTEMYVIPMEQIGTLCQYPNIINSIFLELSQNLHTSFSLASVFTRDRSSVYKESDMKDMLLELGNFLFDNKIYKRAYYSYSKFLNLYPSDVRVNEINEINEKLRLIKNIKSEYAQHSISITENSYKYGEGETITSQFEKSNHLYYLKKGKIKSLLFSGKREYLVDFLNKNTFFGQVSFSSNYRPCTIIADSEVEIIHIPLENLKSFILHQKSEKIIKILCEFALRCWVGYKKTIHLINARNKSSIYIVYDILYIMYEALKNNNDLYDFNFNIKPSELLKMSTFNESFTEENLKMNIQNTSFLKLDKNDNIICKDINILYSLYSMYP